MQINRLDNKTTYRFGDLEVGEVFIECVDGEEYIQLKTETIDDHNAVSLTSGYMYEVDDDTLVIKVNAELTIH